MSSLFKIFIIFFVGNFLEFLVFLGFSLICISRIEIQLASGIERLQYVTKLRPVLIGFAIFSSTVVLGLRIWYSITKDFTSQLLYNLFFAIVFIAYIGMISFSGWRLMKSMKNLYDFSRNQVYYAFLKKVILQEFFDQY